MIASSFLARDIAKKCRGQKTVPLNNLILFCISAINIVGRFFGFFMTSWMVPRGDAPFAAGNQHTCDAQGFFVNMEYIFFVTAYTLLAALYWLIVERSWKEDFMKKTTIRLMFLMPPAILSIIFATIPLFYDQYNVAIVFCYVTPYPPGCDQNAEVDCIRGEAGRLFQTVAFGYTMACNIAIIVFMSMLVYSVYSQERKGDRYLTAGQRANRKNTIKAGWQGIRYICVFTISYIWTYIFMVWNVTEKKRGTGFAAIFYIHVIINPFVGFGNAFVYFKPRYNSYKDGNPDKTMVDGIYHVLNIHFDASWCRIGSCRCCVRSHNTAESALVSPLIEENNNDGEAQPV